MKACSPKNFMDVSDVKVSDEIVFKALHFEIGVLLHEKRAIAVREEPNLHLE